MESSGTAAYHVGEDPDPRTIAVCKKKIGEEATRGYQSTAQRVTEQAFYDFKYIFCMDESNFDDLERLRPADATAALNMLGTWDPEGQLEARRGCGVCDLVGGIFMNFSIYALRDRSVLFDALTHKSLPSHCLHRGPGWRPLRTWQGCVDGGCGG